MEGVMKLEELTITDLNAIVSHCSDREIDLMEDHGDLTDDQASEEFDYWYKVKDLCKVELDKRIKALSL